MVPKDKNGIIEGDLGSSRVLVYDMNRGDNPNQINHSIPRYQDWKKYANKQ